MPSPLLVKVRPKSLAVKVVTLAARADGAERGVEVAQRVRQPRHQVGLVAVLQVVGVEAAEADEEDLAPRADAGAAAGIDHARHDLQLLRQRVERGRGR